VPFFLPFLFIRELPSGRGLGKSAEMLKRYSLRFLEFRVATPMQIFTTAW
jgi:hypothetical protein